MKLSELIAAIGDEKVGYQLLEECLINVSTDKRGESQVTFGTSGGISATEVATGQSRKVGLILWLPREDYERALSQLFEPPS